MKNIFKTSQIDKFDLIINYINQYAVSSLNDFYYHKYKEHPMVLTLPIQCSIIQDYESDVFLQGYNYGSTYNAEFIKILGFNRGVNSENIVSYKCRKNWYNGTVVVRTTDNKRPFFIPWNKLSDNNINIIIDALKKTYGEL